MWLVTAILALFALGISFYLRSSGDIEVPTLHETHWGPEKTKGASTEIRPFKIDVPQAVIDDLKQRLERRRTYVKPLEDVNWNYGISTSYLNTVLDYWKNEYNWTERQKLLNKYPQFITNIQGLDIHYYHVKPNIPKNRNIKVMPLLILHGWPGSVVEFQKIIPMLTTPRPHEDFVFEIIAPSLPGYGFSDGAVRPGLSPAQMAVIFKNLMSRLGFEKYYLQGGDWGSIITASLAVLYPDNVRGLHSNMCTVNSMRSWVWTLIGAYIPSLVVDSEYHSRMYPLSYHFPRILEETGYLHLQASKPDTIGVALSSSPDALAAYILEKFSTWTNAAYKNRPDGGLTEKFTLDELLDNVMVYWVTNSITTSMRLYAEQFSKAYQALKIDELPVRVPTACAAFPHELAYVPEKLLSLRYPYILQNNHFERGGHFAAFEEPALLSEDIYKFVNRTEKVVNWIPAMKQKAQEKQK